jgi:hypothetical protein
MIPRSPVVGAALLVTAVAFAADKPVDGRSTQPPSYTPPVLIGVQGEGKGPRVRPITFPAVNQEWMRVESAHFVILSSAGEKRTREMAAALETLAAAVTRLAPSITASSVRPTRVLVFTRHEEVQPYFDYLLNRENANATGVFVSQKSTGSMIIDAGNGKLPADKTPFHELIHSLMASSEKQPPLWLDEGLAEYFSNSELRNGSIFAGKPVVEHVVALRDGRLMPLPQIFGVVRESDAYNLPSGQRMFYAESWAAVDALMRAAGAKRERFYEFVRDMASGATVEGALKKHFDLTVTDLEQKVRSYRATLRWVFGSTLPVPNVDTKVTTARLERDDLLYELGSFLKGLNPESSEATRHFEATLAINPKHARALAALGRYAEAIAADPKDGEIYVTYGESLLGTQIGLLAEADQPEEKDLAAFRKARELATQALTLPGVDEARARGIYGVSFMIEKDDALAPGIEALQRAHALAPGRTDFAVHLFAFLRRSGDKAEPLLAHLLAARSKQVAFAARAIVVRTELARVNALTKAERLGDAAKVVRELAASTEDPDVRRDFNHQADELERIAETNRQITAYNEAIGQVNAGKYAAARKTLTTLLASATDPGVIKDAQKLQKELAGRKDPK